MTIKFFSASVCATLAALCGPAKADAIEVPSGQPVSFLEFLSENDGDLVRFRFLTPQIGDTFDYMTVFPDFQMLCDTQIVPVLTLNNLTPTKIVLSMSSAEVAFGQDAPDVLQFFEVFSLKNDVCIWEEF